jgi:uncharacterized protein
VQTTKLSAIPIGTTLACEPSQALSPSQRLHLILLGVDDVARSAAFYESLGWKKSPTGHAGFVKIDLGGYALCLISRTDFANDALAPSSHGSGFAGIALIHLAPSADAVARILEKAVQAGGTLIKPATRTPYGIAGYFRDPDGHLFEVDYEECWVFDDAGKLVVDRLA